MNPFSAMPGAAEPGLRLGCFYTLTALPLQMSKEPRQEAPRPGAGRPLPRGRERIFVGPMPDGGSLTTLRTGRRQARSALKGKDTRSSTTTSGTRLSLQHPPQASSRSSLGAVRRSCREALCPLGIVVSGPGSRPVSCVGRLDRSSGSGHRVREAVEEKLEAVLELSAVVLCRQGRSDLGDQREQLLGARRLNVVPTG